MKFKEWPKHESDTKGDEKTPIAHCEPPTYIKSIDLEGLSEEQKKLALDLLTEEQESFSKNDSDIGVIPDLKLEINLHDRTPVQRIM